MRYTTERGVIRFFHRDTLIFSGNFYVFIFYYYYGVKKIKKNTQYKQRTALFLILYSNVKVYFFNKTVRHFNTF